MIANHLQAILIHLSLVEDLMNMEFVVTVLKKNV